MLKCISFMGSHLLFAAFRSTSASLAGVAQQPDPRAVSTRRDESYEPHWEAGDVVWRQPHPRSSADETW